MKYRSTRSSETVTALEALVKGLASDGGLYVPSELPAPFLAADDLMHLSYEELAAYVLSHFFTDIPEEDMKRLTHDAYTGTFETPEIVPVKTMSESFSMAEMFHGRTCAFKDLALSLFPYLLVYAKKQQKDGKEVLILTATSGDTGKAALEGFRDVPGVHIMVFYPSHGVSPLQQDQMQKQLGNNVKVVGIEGNFDDAQGTLKKVFGSDLRERSAEKGVLFSSANSINIGRLVPQIAYYVYAYAKLYANGVIAKDEKINIVVPTGNFGNILAAFYAKNMGIPVAKLICASNENKVLYDFFSTGTYDKNREFMLTSSPSMDILISSNLERLIYRIAGEDAVKNAALMKELNTTGKYEITPEMKEKLADFYGNYASEKETADTIRDLYEKTGYVIDTHTAVAASVYHKYKKDTNDTDTKTVIASTASPFKFSRSVMDAIDPKYDSLSEFELVDELSRIGNVKIPQAIEEIRSAEVRHKTVCEVEEMPEVVKQFLGI